jgi:hypothetical protein
MPMRRRTSTGSTSGPYRLLPWNRPRPRCGRRDEVVHAVEAAQQRALAAAGRPDEGDDLVGRDRRSRCRAPPRVAVEDGEVAVSSSAPGRRMIASVMRAHGRLAWPAQLTSSCSGCAADRHRVHGQQHDEQHDDPAAAISWNSGCGRETQLKIWTGSTVNWSIGTSGTNGTKASAPIRSAARSRRSARERARIVPVRIPGQRHRQHLPRTSASAWRRARRRRADRVRHRLDRLLRAMMITGRISSASVSAPASTLRPSAHPARTKTASPRMPYTMDGTPARLAMFIWMVA